MNDRAALELALRRAPDSVPRRLVLADFLEENGEQGAADAHRWLAAWRRRPCLVGERLYAWLCQNGEDVHAASAIRPLLPRALYKGLPARNLFPRRYLAEAAVVDAWPRALAAGWVPEWPPADAPRCGPSPLRGAYAWLKAAEAGVRGVPEVPWDTPTAPTPLDDVQAAVEATLTYYDPALAAQLPPPA